MLVDDQISTHGKATTKTPLKANKESLTALVFLEHNWGSCTRQYFRWVARRSPAALNEVITMSGALITPTMDYMEDDSTAEDLPMSTDQRMSICRFIFWSTQFTDILDRILPNGCSLFHPPVAHQFMFYNIFFSTLPCAPLQHAHYDFS